MKRLLLFSVIILASTNMLAQDYKINFTGSGAASIVENVVVVNLENGDSLTLSGTDTLHLVFTAGIYPIADDGYELRVYPNPMNHTCRVEFYKAHAGKVVIGITDISGKNIILNNQHLTSGLHVFEVSGIKQGIHLLNVTANEFNYTGRIVSLGSNTGSLNIKRLTGMTDENAVYNLKSTKNTIQMLYTDGERLLFKGNSENHSRIITMIPSQSQTIDFEFVDCEDGDGNQYAVVTIGNQTWMAENLKTTKYANGNSIVYPGNDNTAWQNNTTGAYAWYDNNVSWKNRYGAIYNWYAVNNPNDLCPAGWKVPDEISFSLLSSHLGGDSYAGGKLKSTRTDPNPHPRWDNPNFSASNESGFTGLPGGFRFNSGDYSQMGSNGAWWSATEESSSLAFYYTIYFFGSNLQKSSGNNNTGYYVRCIKDDGSQVNLPTVITYEAYDITAISAKSGGNVTDDGGADVIVRGVCWSTNPNPTTNDNFTINGNGTGTFISSLPGLMHGTSYYVRAYATNITGTAYGNEEQFTTEGAPCTGTPTVTDIDGNVYNTVQMGSQCWMKENLKTTKYKNGVALAYPGANASEWTSNTTGAYAWYNNDISWKHIYGALYNGYATQNSNGLCPEGWQVPTHAEWTALTNFISGGSSTGGLQLKSCRQVNSPLEGGCSTDLHPRWDEHTACYGTEKYGFSAIPGGRRLYNTANFDYIGVRSYFWTRTVSFGDGYYRIIRYDQNQVTNTYTSYPRYGFSVRCIKNQ